MNKIMDYIPQFIVEKIPQSVKKLLLNLFGRRLQRDLERFEKDGTRFVPPLSEFPPIVRIEITTRCNLNCSHCPHGTLSKNKEFLKDMDSKLFFKVIDEIASESPETLVRPFGGGEPLMRKDLGELIRYARNKGVHNISINTNGSLLTESRRKELIESGLTHLEVSIDAATYETYKKIKNLKIFDKVVGNTLAYIDESRKVSKDNKVSVSFVLQKDNQAELDTFKNFWQGKATYITIRNYHQHAGLVDNHGKIVQRDMSKRYPCPYLWGRMIVFHNGDVLFCEYDWEGKYSIGNVNDNTLKEIWRGEAYSSLRKQHINGSIIHPFCQQCTDWEEVRW